MNKKMYVVRFDFFAIIFQTFIFQVDIFSTAKINNSPFTYSKFETVICKTIGA